MTLPPSTSGKTPSAPPQPPPTEVAQAAASRQLGALIAAQRGTNPFGNLAFGLGGGIVLIVGGIVLAWLGSLLKTRALVFVACPMIVIGLFALVLAVAAIRGGFTATYLYQNGLVHTKNKKVDVVAWSEVDQLWLWKAGGKTALAGKMLNYYVVTLDGRKVLVEAHVAKGEQPLGALLEQTVAQLRRPVVDSGPYVGKLRA